MTKEDYIHIRVTDEEKQEVMKLVKQAKLRTMSSAMLLATEFALLYKDFFKDWLKIRSE